MLGFELEFTQSFFIEPSSFHAVKLVGEGEGIPKFLTNNIFTKVFYEILKKHGNDGSFKFYCIIESLLQGAWGLARR